MSLRSGFGLAQDDLRLLLRRRYFRIMRLKITSRDFIGQLAPIIHNLVEKVSFAASLPFRVQLCRCNYHFEYDRQESLIIEHGIYRRQLIYVLRSVLRENSFNFRKIAIVFDLQPPLLFFRSGSVLSGLGVRRRKRR